jgi:hypothetical protein
LGICERAQFGTGTRNRNYSFHQNLLRYKSSENYKCQTRREIY